VQRARGRSIRNEPFTDCLVVAAGAFILTGTAAFFEHRVQRLKGGGMRHGCEKIGPRIFDQGLDFPFVVVEACRASILGQFYNVRVDLSRNQFTEILVSYP
jgi:hypothetical protein